MTRASVTLALIIAMAGAIATRAQERFRSSAEAVRLDVLVLDGRKPVRGLTAKDFDVRDSGSAQQIRVEPAAGAVDVILTLDVSDSLSPSRLAALRAAARDVIELLGPADRIQIVTFNHLVTLRSPLGSSRAESLAALDQLQPAGGTALRDAAFAALMSVPVPADDRRIVQLILSDGDDTASWLTDAQVRTALRRSPVVVYALAPAEPPPASMLPVPMPAGARPGRTGSAIDLRATASDALRAGFLRDAARDTGGRGFPIDKPEATAAAFRDVLQEFRQRYVVTFTPSSDAKGWHPVSVAVNGRRGAAVFVRSGYFRD